MGRNRKKGGGAGAVENREPELDSGGGGNNQPFINPPEPQEEVPVEPQPQPRQRMTPEQVFGPDIYDPGIPRQLEPGGIRTAWNNATAAQLGRALEDAPTAQSFTMMYNLPTAREYFDIPSKERAPLTKREVLQLADVIGGSEIVRNDGYDALLRDLGLEGMPRATSRTIRVGRDTKPMVTRVSRLARKLPGIENLNPEDRARVGAILDVIGGISLTRERAWETMILTRGQTTPKGEVMGRQVKRLIAEGRRLSNEINRIMGDNTPPRKDGLPKPGTPGAQVYDALFTKAGRGHDFRARNHKAPMYADRGLEQINND